ncbi:MAG: hypothetical protein IJ677_08265 [Alphaproteobacteria bacterium]|nr:hypothetical protein [Alphaproteobacteria bacterium]
MDMYPQYKSALGYQIGEDGVDSYGVNHNRFSTRDELEYQVARQQRENQLIQNYNNQGITQDYPQQGTEFWGSNTNNNYGFGSSDISSNIENIVNQLNNNGLNGTNSGQGQVNNGYTLNAGDMDANQPSNTNSQEIHNRIFNGVDCGGMTPEFADKIAYTESRGGCQNNINDYGCVNNTASAFGRYQMQVPALKDAGYMDNKGDFFPETGVNNMQEFLNNPQAQEQAMCNYLDRIDKYNKNWNNYKYLGKDIQVGNLTVPITKDMMLAGTHREGARKLNEWLNDAKFQNNNLVRDPIYDQQDKKRRNITKRFKEILYPPK